jgi:diacylglycerol kinase (ATP)
MNEAETLKSRGGLLRVWKALGYSLQGLRAAVRNEAAFRQELALGLPLLLAAPWVGRSGPEVLALAGVVLLVWVVELLNSALEALADAISLERRELLGRAKDLGSAAVLMTLLFACAVWAWVLWDRWGH